MGGATEGDSLSPGIAKFSAGADAVRINRSSGLKTAEVIGLSSSSLPSSSPVRDSQTIAGAFECVGPLVTVAEPTSLFPC